MSDPSHSVRLNVEWFLNSPLPPVVLAPETCSDSYSQLLPPEAAATLCEVLINVTATQTVEGHCVIQTRTMSGCSPFFITCGLRDRLTLNAAGSHFVLMILEMFGCVFHLLHVEMLIRFGIRRMGPRVLEGMFSPHVCTLGKLSISLDCLFITLPYFVCVDCG